MRLSLTSSIFNEVNIQQITSTNYSTNPNIHKNTVISYLYIFLRLFLKSAIINVPVLGVNINRLP